MGDSYFPHNACQKGASLRQVSPSVGLLKPSVFTSTTWDSTKKAKVVPLRSYVVKIKAKSGGNNKTLW